MDTILDWISGKVTLEQIETALRLAGSLCLIGIAFILIGFVRTTEHYRKQLQRKYRRTETEKRLGRERI